MQSIISDSCFQLKSWFNVDARAPSIPLLNFPFNKVSREGCSVTHTGNSSTKIVRNLHVVWSRRFKSLLGMIHVFPIQYVGIENKNPTYNLKSPRTLNIKKLLNFDDCLGCIMMFRWINKQPEIRKFWNWCCHYQEIYDWISPLFLETVLHKIMVYSNTAFYRGNDYDKSGHLSIVTLLKHLIEVQFLFPGLQFYALSSM